MAIAFVILVESVVLVSVVLVVECISCNPSILLDIIIIGDLCNTELDTIWFGQVFA